MLSNKRITHHKDGSGFRVPGSWFRVHRSGKMNNLESNIQDSELGDPQAETRNPEPETRNRACEASILGLTEYTYGLRLQERAVEQLRTGEGPERLFLLEHPHVFTLGRGADSAHILADPDRLQSHSIEVHET